VAGGGESGAEDRSYPPGADDSDRSPGRLGGGWLGGAGPASRLRARRCTHLGDPVLDMWVPVGAKYAPLTRNRDNHV